MHDPAFEGCNQRHGESSNCSSLARLLTDPETRAYEVLSSQVHLTLPGASKLKDAIHCLLKLGDNESSIEALQRVAETAEGRWDGSPARSKEMAGGGNAR